MRFSEQGRRPCLSYPCLFPPKTSYAIKIGRMHIRPIFIKRLSVNAMPHGFIVQRLLVGEAIAIGEAAGGEDVRSERPEVDGSAHVVVVEEEVLVVLVFVGHEVDTPVLLLVSIGLKSGCLLVGNAAEESLDG